MASDPHSGRAAQLDEADRSHLEGVVTAMRERVEDNVAFQLAQRGLDDEPADVDSLDAETRRLVEAIELEAPDDDSWSEALDQYVTGVGYTIVNRLAALRCTELRGFIDEEVTVFKETGLTPAAETLVHEEFLLEDEAILRAYHDACDDLAEEIGILFDRSSAYSLIDPDDDTFEELCGMLDRVADEVWRADDVLGWVYEYYNVNLLDDLRRKGDREGLDPEDVPAANQFYTPHWVVRMLTDNSLGKLYLEHTGELEGAVDTQARLTADERKHRPLSPEASPDVADFCTYLVPSEEGDEPADFEHPRELQVIDPACGSGHFLLYAFDVLERIWRAETDVPTEEIPRKIISHNLYGVDLDMRACQLAAFNLYLKGRTRAEAAGAEGFEMPEAGIVCADASVADVSGVQEVFAEVADGRAGVEDALERILDAFEAVHGLGSLLDVRGTLEELFADGSDGRQLALTDDFTATHTLSDFLASLRDAVSEHREEASFLARDLRSFVRLLDILSQHYDVALMNPPYGAQGRMPDVVQDYVEDRYEYGPEFYVNFFEVCDTLTTDAGRIGMLVPRSFMFKRSFHGFRADFVGNRGGFDFLAEFGLGILDNATVRTVGTVVRSGASRTSSGTFIRLHDADSRRKEDVFADEVLTDTGSAVERVYDVPLSEFGTVPRTPLSYYTPDAVRALHETDLKLDAGAASIDGDSVCDVKTGLQTGDNDRFIRAHWEVPDFDDFVAFTKGGADAWVLPRTSLALHWGDDGAEIKRQGSSVVRNERHYFEEGLTWTYIKEGGRRFGFFPAGGIFDQKGPMTFPPDNLSAWTLLAVLNSELFHGLFLSLTPDREWNPGDVGRIPWDERLGAQAELATIAKQQYELVLTERVTDPASPYYRGPRLLPPAAREDFFYDHPHTDVADELPGVDGESPHTDQSFSDTVERAVAARDDRDDRLEALQERADAIVYDSLGIPPDVRESVATEIELRGNGSGSVPSTRDVDEALRSEVESLVHHVALTVVDDAADGIVPLEPVDDEASMYDRVVAEFEDVYGTRADDRLAEVDGVLGSRSDDHDAYPNLRAFLSDGLFEVHVDRMANAPILWRLTTNRLVSDADSEGFGCYVDYRRFDATVLDRLRKTYLEARKATLRERRNAAERRRNDETVPTADRTAAAAAYERCVSGLSQIGLFEEALEDLAGGSPREWTDDDRAIATDLRPKVDRFRERTSEFLGMYERLAERNDRAWLEETFSRSFVETIEDNGDAWLDALAELENACEAYGRGPDEPVPAHLYDLFVHFGDELVGSVWPTSTGVLAMGYYPRREAAGFLDENGEPKQSLPDETARLLARIAAGFDEYETLADEIESDCRRLQARIPGEWRRRATSEVTTGGYRPIHKHGVAVNVAPLAEAGIVPELVAEQVV